MSIAKKLAALTSLGFCLLVAPATASADQSWVYTLTGASTTAPAGQVYVDSWNGVCRVSWTVLSGPEIYTNFENRYTGAITGVGWTYPGWNHWKDLTGGMYSMTIWKYKPGTTTVRYTYSNCSAY